MKYYVFRIETNATTGNENRQTYSFDSEDAAEVKYHEILASDINNTNLGSALVILIDMYGVIHLCRRWEKAVNTDTEDEA